MSLMNGFSPEDNLRLAKLLQKLRKHIPTEEFVIVGSVAVNYHLINSNIKPVIRPIHDLNIILKAYSDIKPEILEDLLVYHNHKLKDDFYLALVDKESRTYVNIFNYYNWPPKSTVLIGGFNVISLEEQLVRHVEELSWILESRPRNRHMYEHTKLMLQIANLEVAEKLWRVKKPTGTNLVETVKAVEEHLKGNNELLVERVHKKKEPYVCKDCTEELPITPMKEIFEILKI